jgi:hypothetical protein
MPINIDSTPDTGLGRISVIGQAHRGRALWQIEARAERVPLTGRDAGTPATHGLRTLWMRSISRTVKTRSHDVAYLDPTLLDAFVSAGDDDGKYSLDILGRRCDVTLDTGQRIDLTPLGAQPGYAPPPPRARPELRVSPFLIVAGSLSIPDPVALGSILPHLDPGGRVDLDRDGIVYTARVVTPLRDGAGRAGENVIASRVRLSLAEDKLTLTLLPGKLDARTTQAWLAEWRRLAALVESTRITAWARLNFEVADAVPSLTWPVKVSGHTMSVDWQDALLPARLVTVTLADQPIESQLLAPEQVLTLVPHDVRIVSNGSKFTLSTQEVAGAELVYKFSAAAVPPERLGFTGPLRMVHTPSQVRSALRAAYGPLLQPDGDVLTGFLQEADGWVELPFAGNPALPDRAILQAALNVAQAPAHGSFMVGTRRPELHEPGAVARQVPWSMRVDVPSAFDVRFEFDGGKLETAQVSLLGTAAQARGLVWLCNRAPDGHDALPLTDPDPGAFFDVVLDRAVTGKLAAPFLLQGTPGIEMIAPLRPKSGNWDDHATPRWLRAPSLGADVGFTIDLGALGVDQDASSSPGGPAPARAWLQHPSLPVIQCMPGTRSDPASPRPHASRGLVLFQQSAPQLRFMRAAGMAPALDPVQRAQFAAIAVDGTPPALAVLSLPGIELKPETPVTYQACGRYGLPVLDEAFARAVLPLPPGAEPPPTPAPVTALDQAALMEMWRDQGRRRANAALQSDLMFAAAPDTGPATLTPTALAEPRILAAKAVVSAAVVIVPGVGATPSALKMGMVSFAQVAPAWAWSASGDELLAGPEADLDFRVGGKVKVGVGKERMRGWTFAERLVNSLTIDGRGVGWDGNVVPRGEVMLRTLGIERKQGTERRTLASSIEALAIGGTGAAMWRLAFTDLPMPEQGAGTWMPGTSDMRLAACEQGWTWSLYEAHQWQTRTLLLYGIFRFAPAALASVSIDAVGQVSRALVEGTLTLGDTATSLTTHAGCRVRLDFVRRADHGILHLHALAALDDPSGRIHLDLHPEAEGGVISSNVAQFSALPSLESGVLLLKDARLDATLFGGNTSIALGELKAGSTELSYKVKAPASPLVMGLTRLDLDLAKARLKLIGFTVALRDDVKVEVIETVSGGVAATIDWFGNATVWKIEVDNLRRSLRLWGTNKDSKLAATAVELFPGVLDGRFDTGMLCLTLGAPQGNAQFAVRTHFFEAIFKASDALCITHLMHSGDKHGVLDVLRFDGKLARKNLVTWPDLHTSDVGKASSIEVEFATADVVVQAAVFLLSDHRLPGSAVKKALSKGLALRDPAPGNAPVTWLVEATHTLSWHTGGVAGPTTLVRHLQCMQTLQLWSGAQLASALVEHGQQFGFTASYAGAPSSDFPNAGVRKVEMGFSGLFESGISQAISKLDESWLMLGNMTAMCPDDGSLELFLPLHLPFIGALDDSPQLDPVRTALGGAKQDASSVLRMSRHDILGLPMRIDATQATPTGMLASLPTPMPIPFALAALPADTLSGEALAAGWLHSSGQLVESGLHVEQIQFPGRASDRPRLPHPFPRAAVMLDYFRRWKTRDGLPALSLLVQFTGTGNGYATSVRIVQVQPAPAINGAAVHRAAVELIIGSATGLTRQLVDTALASTGYARQLLAIAMEHTGDPTFLLLRQANADGAAGLGCCYTRVELPARVADPLALPTRALRPAESFSTDGRLTWPEARTEGSGRKTRLAARWAPREPFQHPALGVAGLKGSVLPGREAGEIFSFEGMQGPEAPQTMDAPATVWLQEWEKVAFAKGPLDPEDAPPSAYDRPVPVRPLAPTARAVAAAIGRMDPVAALAGRAIMQTYLPPLIEDVDLPSRLSTITVSGLRLLRTWDDGKGREDAPALAGPAQTRSMRTPRPVAIPANRGNPSRWGRTVGWYGEPAASCLALQGGWDLLAADPGADGIPPWCILIGKPMRVRLEPMVQHQEQGWRGAVRLACEVLVLDASGLPARHSDPARFILDALFLAGDSVRAGLRTEQEWMPFYSAVADGKHAIEFAMKRYARRVSAGMACSFECGWNVASGPFEGDEKKDLLLPPYKAPQTLDPTVFRKLTLPLPPTSEHQYSLPLIERSVFFSDPAFDSQLSRIKGLSDSVRVDDAVLSFWLDRPSATPGETVVLRAALSGGLHSTLALSATIKRKAGNVPEDAVLLFQFDPRMKDIVIDNGAYLALPLSLLADASGKGVSPGDILRLELKPAVAANKLTKSVVLFLPVRVQSALTAPQALYSLIGVDAQVPRAWCARHSAAPQPDGLVTHVLEDKGQGISRRALFKWRLTQKSDAFKLGFSICKVDLVTESTHVPEILEIEFPVV